MVTVMERLTALHELVLQHRRELLAQLSAVETLRTAEVELDWLSAALMPSTSSVAWLSERRGVGTVYSATPATLPMYSLLLFALAPALVGNHVVARPASATRGCSELLAGLAAEAGIPIEVTGEAWSSFAAAAEHGADGMVFCGSREHAVQLDQQLPESVRLVCQGPGNCAFVVTAEADLTAAARAAVESRMFNSSQDCLATERVYVAEEVAEPFIDALVVEAGKVAVGSNADPETTSGPLLIPGAADRWLRDLDEQGTVLRPAHHHGDGRFDLGVCLAKADAPVVLEETYCPVLPVVTYKDEAQLREMMLLGDFAAGLTVFGALPRFGTLDFAHVAVNETLYSYEDAWAPFGGHRATTLLRSATTRRAGPVLVPYALSEPM